MNERLGIVDEGARRRARYHRERLIDWKPEPIRPNTPPKPSRPAGAPKPLLRGAIVFFYGAPETMARRFLEFGSRYTVARCETIAGETRVRLAERPGFTFARALFLQAN